MVYSSVPMGALLDPPRVDAEWMQSVLQDAGALPPGAKLEAVRFESYLGTGQLGRSARFALDWASPEGCPRTVVAKIPGMEPALTGVLFDTGMYDAEIAFYEEIASRVDVELPRCFHAFGSRDDLLFVVLMEDLEDYTAGDQLHGVSVDNLYLAVEQAAALHGPCWADRELEQIGFFRSFGGADRPKRNAEGYRECLPIALERLGGRLSADAVDFVERLGERIEDLLMLDPGTPKTVVHGDFRPDNFLISDKHPERPLVVVDWQTMGLGWGAGDLAYLIGGALDAESRCVVEDELLREYLGFLHGRYGLTQYDDAQLRRDYARGSINGVLVAVTATVRALRTERGDDLFTLMIERHAAHAREHGALELVT